MSRRSGKRRRGQSAAAPAAHRSASPTAPAQRKRVWRFLVLLLLIGGGLYAVYHYPYPPGSAPERMFGMVLGTYASATGAILNLLGPEVTVHGQSVSNGFDMRVVKSCDAMEAKCLFVAAVLAFPAPWLRRVIGVVAGLAALIGMNLVRLCSLYFIGLHWPSWFDVAHEEVWQFVTIAFAAGIWVLWAVWVTPRRKVAVADATD